MIDPHAPLHAFADGELSEPEAERFRDHLATCAKCQRELHDVLQLDAIAQASPVLQRPTAPVERPGVRAWWPLALAAAAAAVALVVTRRPENPLEPELSAVTLAGPRHTEARVSWQVADQWRPYDALRGERTVDSIPLSTLAGLEKLNDTRALGSAWLINGDPVKARSLLKQLPPGADVSADLAAVALNQGHADEALELAQVSLLAKPGNSRALWNQALAARELGLTAVAAQRFGQVEALHEPGWSDEAAKRRAALEARAQSEQATFTAALNAGAKMTLEHQPMSPALVTAAPSLARMQLAYALRTATSKDEVEALRPVAVQLVPLLGNAPQVLTSLDRAAAADFKARAALTRGFRAVYVRYFQQLIALGQPIELPAGSKTFEGTEEASFRTLLVAQGNADDLALGLPMLGLVTPQFAAYSRAVQSLGDPWFDFALKNEQAKAALAKGDAAAAERGFLDVLRSGTSTAPLRVMQAANLLSVLYIDQHRAAEAQTVALKGLTLARAQHEVLIGGQLLNTLADAARYRNLKGLAEATLEERALRQPGACYVQRYSDESLGALYLMSFDAERARPALQHAASCGEPLSLVGAFSLSDLIRLSPTKEDLARFDAALTALRGSLSSPTDLAMVDHIEGRVRLDTDAAAGERLLRSAMKAVSTDSSATARKIRAYGFGLLRNQQASQQKFDALFALTQEELGRPLPEGCALVVDVEDDRIAVAGRQRGGAVTGAFARVPRSRPHPDGVELTEIADLVAPIARQAFKSCGPNEALRVYAGFPLHGRAGWLPDEIAWSYASGLPERTLVPGKSVVVTDVDAPAELDLPHLAAWQPSAAFQVDTVVRGAQATPEGVLEAMRDASFIEFDAHGLVNTGSDDTALLVLSPGATGFALTAAKVGQQQLNHHPVVLLGACRAATVAPMMHESWSLPHAFLRAGASGVIAAPIDLPDAETHDFFEKLTIRVASGTNAARALQYERSKWLAAGKAHWVRSVLVFE